MPKDVIAVGASAGGLTALRELVSGLSPELDASVFVVLHVSPDGPNLLAEILRLHTKLKVIDPSDGDRIERGVIYVGRPDHHLLVESGQIRVTRGPKENRHRPSVDALFRSAAVAFGSRVVGVVLTGNLDDGTAGLSAVKQRGGTTVVQDPKEAAFPSMPENALRYVEVDHVVQLAQLAPLLNRLARESKPSAEVPVNDEMMEIEARLARGDKIDDREVLSLGALSPYTCPQCHGTLVGLKEGGIARYRCHTGHAYSVETLVAEMTAGIEDSLWTTVRTMEEQLVLLRALASRERARGHEEAAQRFDERVSEAHRRSDQIRHIVLARDGRPAT